MSTTLNCPDCDEKVTLKPGRSSARCPACGSNISADRPTAKVSRRKDDDDDREERAEKKRPKRKYREEWDDDDDEDERKPPPKPKSSLAWLWITLTIVLVLLAGCAGLVWWVVTLLGQAKQNLQQRLEKDQQQFEQRMNAGPGNPQGRPKAPLQQHAGTYKKTKPFDVDPQMNKAGPVYLDDLEPFDVKQGEWPLGRHGTLGFDDRWVCVNGQYYDHGIGLIPPNNGAARVSFAVGGQARRLKGQVALNDYWHDNDSWDEVTFAIYKDGKEIWRSKAMKSKKRPESFDVDITGARVIMIEAYAPKSSHDAHCVWLDPVLEK